MLLRFLVILGLAFSAAGAPGAWSSSAENLSFYEVRRLLGNFLRVDSLERSEGFVVDFKDVHGHQYGTLRQGAVFWGFLPFYRCLNNELDECWLQIGFSPEGSSHPESPAVVFLDSYAVNYLHSEQVLAEHFCPLRLVEVPHTGAVQVWVAHSDEGGWEVLLPSSGARVWKTDQQGSGGLRVSALLTFNPNPQGFQGDHVQVMCHYEITQGRARVWTEVSARVQLDHVSGFRGGTVSQQALSSTYTPFVQMEGKNPMIQRGAFSE